MKKRIDPDSALKPIFQLVDALQEQGIFSARLAEIVRSFCTAYMHAVSPSGVAESKSAAVLLHLVDLAARQIRTPYTFPCIHQQVRRPIDYYAFGIDLIAPLVDTENSQVYGWENLARIEQQLGAGESCVLLSNHQIEPDPQVISILLQDRFPALAEKMFFVAGDRVTTDPLAVPLSLGRNLVCIYSKKHIDHPPEHKMDKLQHNRKAIQQLARLLNEGGHCVFVAPSGGRDRPNDDGKVEVAPFDPQSIEMFSLLAQQSSTLVHFYPMAMQTFHLVPPPRTVQKEIGEERRICRTSVGLAVGEELAFASLGGQSDDKKERRRLRAEAIWQLVRELYTQIT